MSVSKKLKKVTHLLSLPPKQAALLTQCLYNSPCQKSDLEGMSLINSWKCFLPRKQGFCACNLPVEEHLGQARRNRKLCLPKAATEIPRSSSMELAHSKADIALETKLECLMPAGQNSLAWIPTETVSSRIHGYEQLLRSLLAGKRWFNLRKT